jgi:RNAse (barnase) inhibitor barstar
MVAITAMDSLWDGVSRAGRAVEVPLRLVLKAQEVAYARERGIRELYREVDSSDLADRHLLDGLPFERGIGYLVWVREF